MANALYNAARADYLSGGGDFDADAIRVRLVDSSYVFSQAHVTMSDIGAGLADSGSLATKTTTNGTANADDVVFSSVPSGDTATGFVVYKFVTNDADSIPICFCDTDLNGAISVPTNGSDVTIQWNAVGIFTL